MTPNKQGTEKCCVGCNDFGNCVFKDCMCHGGEPFFHVPKYPTKCACGITDISHTPYCKETSPQGDTPEWEKEFDEKFGIFYQDGYGSDMRLIKDFIHNLLLQAKEQERQEIVEAIEKYKMSENEKSAEKRQYAEIYNQTLEDVISLITNRGK